MSLLRRREGESEITTTARSSKRSIYRGVTFMCTQVQLEFRKLSFSPYYVPLSSLSLCSPIFLQFSLSVPCNIFTKTEPCTTHTISVATLECSPLALSYLFLCRYLFHQTLPKFLLSVLLFVLVHSNFIPCTRIEYKFYYIRTFDSPCNSPSSLAKT